MTDANRNLRTEIQAGRFREDLYYRLCADLIQTPSLREQIEDSPGGLRGLLLFMVRRSVGDEAERCVRNVIVRRSYRPLADRKSSVGDFFPTRFRARALTADEVVSYYAAQVYRQTGSYENTARQPGIDRRTVKSNVEKFLSAATRFTCM